uniref:SbsA Ig-like domain-containing protein n=1 Tax=Bellilinea caldifistulae TaxID=360411 RepID=A0A7C4Q581_9CHLR
MMKWRGGIVGLLLSAVLLILPAACQPSQPVDDGVVFSDEEGDLPPPTQIPTTPPPTLQPDDVPQGIELAECPRLYNFVFLKFSSEIDFNVEQVALHYSLGDGVLTLEVTQETPRVILQPQSTITLPVTIRGVTGDCTYEGQSSMIATASGYCENGIVRLIIEENWQPGSGVMSCPDHDPVQGPLPAPGKMTHRGGDGRGEVFYLDAGFSDQNIGYMLEKPFQGQGGSGSHIWTLVMEPIQLILPVSTP